MSVGSGTLVAIGQHHGLVVTNWHVVRDAKGEISVAFPDGFRSGASVLKVDEDWDLAALLIWRPHVTPVPIASTPPRPGDALTIAGYGQGNYRSVKARCTQYVSPGDNFPYEMVEVSAEARDGDSGGPILNDRGELAGVLFGAGRGTTSGSHSSRVRLFLAEVWPPRQDDQGYSHVASAPTLGDPEFYPGTDPTLREPKPFVADRKPQDRSAPPLATDSQPFRRDDLPTVQKTEAQPPPIQQYARPNADAANPLWSRGDVPTEEPTFVRVTSDDELATTQPNEESSPSPSPVGNSANGPSGPADWDWILGNTTFEKAKSILAAIGLLAVVIQLAKWSDRKEEDA